MMMQSPISSCENTNETMIDYETDPNYLAFSDTDTVECYTVPSPSPIYPALPDRKDQHIGIIYYARE